MNKKKFDTLILMPYLPLDGVIKFGNLILWPYNRLKGSLIKDASLRSHLDGLVNYYQMHKGNPLQNPAVISVSKVRFTNPNRITIAKIETLKSVLLLAELLEINSWSFITSDNFEVFYQRFTVGNSNISTQAGSIHRILTGGYRIGQISFVKPEYVNLPLSFRLSGAVFRALEDCMINSITDKRKSRIIQSLSPLFSAYRNGSEHSWQSRILQLIMAFELLFGETGRPRFRNNILKYSTLGLNRQFQTYRYPIANRGIITGHEQLTLHQIWAEEFYKLRHKIIHGDTVYSDDFIFKDLLNMIKSREPHFYIAVNFFIVCVTNKLRELGFTNVVHLAVDPEAREPYIGKHISGIKNEKFKIIRVNPFGTMQS